MDFVRKPETFDVVVASNLFGDILTDLSAAVTGSIGLAAQREHQPEADVPEHVRAGPRLAPRTSPARASPTRWRRSCRAALMLDHLGLAKSAAAVRDAVAKVLAEGKVKTPDLGGKSTTAEMGEAVLSAIGG